MQYSILLVEDDRDDAEMILYALNKLKLHCEVFHMDDSVKALQSLLDGTLTPTLLLLDLKMPKVDGIQILHKLKLNANRRHIPVVTMIASAQGKSYVESFGICPEGYLEKPVSHTDFMQILKDLSLDFLATERVDKDRIRFVTIL